MRGLSFCLHEMLQERKWMGRAVYALRNFAQSRARCTGPLRWLRQGFAVLGNCCACGVNKRAASYRFSRSSTAAMSPHQPLSR